jgi:hypothetical protein
MYALNHARRCPQTIKRFEMVYTNELRSALASLSVEDFNEMIEQFREIV